MLLVCFIDSVLNQKDHLKSSYSIIIAAIVFMAFISRFRIHQTKEWYFDAYTDVMLKEITSIEKGKNVYLVSSWQMGSAIEYYNRFEYDGKVKSEILNKADSILKPGWYCLMKEDAKRLQSQLQLKRLYKNGVGLYAGIN
jgi:hypothetical protein